MRRRDAGGERGDEQQIGGRDEHAGASRDAVIGATLGGVARAASAASSPCRRAARMSSRIGLGKKKAIATRPANPTSQTHGERAAIARPPSSGRTGSRLKRLRKKPMKASACQKWLPVASQIPSGTSVAIEPRIGPGQADACLRAGVVAHRLGRDHGAQEGDEHRRRGLDPLAPELEDVPELVQEQEQHEADREEPAEDQLVGGDRDEHRGRGREQLQLRQRDEQELRLGAELRDQEAERRRGRCRSASAAPDRGLSRDGSARDRLVLDAAASISRFNV